MSNNDYETLSDNLSFHVEIDNLNFGDCVHLYDNYDEIIISLKDLQSLKAAVDKIIADKG